MSELPIFRNIHKEEADHHAELVCSRKRLKKGTKKYKEEYNKAFLAYIKDAQDSLYPSGELTPQKNPQETAPVLSTLEMLRRASPVVGHLTEAEYRKLCNSKDWKYIAKIYEFYTNWYREWNKHLKRPNGKVSDLETMKMAKIQKKLERHLAKDSKISNPVQYAIHIIEMDRDSFRKKYDNIRKQIVKKVVGR